MKLSLGKTIVGAAAILVVASIIAGVILVGSPAEGRLQQLDSARIEDLRGIMAAVDSVWVRNERLPASLEDLAANPRVRVNTVDPGSAEAYDYALLDGDTYELCATFDLESLAPGGRTSADFWSHGVGRQCFQLNVGTSGLSASAR